MAHEPSIGDEIRERRPGTNIVGAISLKTGQACTAFRQHDRRSSEPAAGEVIEPQVPSLTAAPTGSRLHFNLAPLAAAPQMISEDAMRKYVDADENLLRDDGEVSENVDPGTGCRIGC